MPHESRPRAELSQAVIRLEHRRHRAALSPSMSLYEEYLSAKQTGEAPTHRSAEFQTHETGVKRFLLRERKSP